jgi:leucine-rich repeat kinase 2
MEESKLNLTMDKSELQQAVKFLHESGVILHYSDLQTKLSELYFLDPEWLCTLMAHIITFKHISFVDDKGVSGWKCLRTMCVHVF